VNPQCNTAIAFELNNIGLLLSQDRILRMRDTMSALGFRSAALSAKEASDFNPARQVESPSSPGVLNLFEASAYLRCSRAHLSNIVNGKVHGIPRLPTVRIGRRILFRRESLELWLQEVESTTPARHRY
jgi:hypothetical protein